MSEPKWPALVFTARKLLRIARKAANRSKTEPDQALVAILFSAAAIEGFVNEVLEATKLIHDDPNADHLKQLLVEAEEQKANIGLKLQIMNSICCGKPIPRGERPYQDIDLLFKVRNALVHLRPDRATFGLVADSERKPHGSVDQLALRGIVSKQHALGARTWLELASNPEVANWAFETAWDVAKFIYGILPPGTLKDVLGTAWTKRKSSLHLVYLGQGSYAYKVDRAG